MNQIEIADLTLQFDSNNHGFQHAIEDSNR